MLLNSLLLSHSMYLSCGPGDTETGFTQDEMLFPHKLRPKGPGGPAQERRCGVWIPLCSGDYQLLLDHRVMCSQRCVLLELRLLDLHSFYQVNLNWDPVFREPLSKTHHMRNVYILKHVVNSCQNTSTKYKYKILFRLSRLEIVLKYKLWKIQNKSTLSGAGW